MGSLWAKALRGTLGCICHTAHVETKTIHLTTMVTFYVISIAELDMTPNLYCIRYFKSLDISRPRTCLEV